MNNIVIVTYVLKAIVIIQTNCAHMNTKFKEIKTKEINKYTLFLLTMCGNNSAWLEAISVSTAAVNHAHVYTRVYVVHMLLTHSIR